MSLTDDFQETVIPRDITPEEGVSIMFDAVNLDDRETARALIEAGVPVDARNEYGDTPLMLAIHRGHFEMAKDFVNMHADPNAKNNDGLTPLYYAARENALMMKLVLDAGAQGLKGTPEMMTQCMVEGVMSGFEIVVEATLAAGANPNKMFSRSDDASALHIAAQNANPRMLKALIKAGANVNATDNNKRSVLRAALQSGDVACVKMVLDAGADTGNISLDPGTGNSVTDRSFGVSCCFEIAEAVADAARKFEMIDKAREGDVAAVRKALADGIKPDTFDRFGLTALHWAAGKNHLDVVKALIEGGATPGISNNAGVTPMFIAVSKDAVECARALGEAGASVLQMTSAGETPAGFVAEKPPSVMKTLMEQFKAAEIEKMAKGATTLEGTVTPMKKLRFAGARGLTA